MIEVSLSDLAQIVSGTVVAADGSARASGPVVTDSRLAVAGSIFFAIRGETTDGHLFAQQALDSGALVAVVESSRGISGPHIVVADTVAALGALAHEVVARVRAAGGLKVVAVTGSNGKTTTKNMLAAVLSAEGETVAPSGSLNNDIGAPSSMLQTTWSTRFLVVEMGADGPGDIARLQRIVTPDVGIVLVVGLAHVGKFGSPDATARAKAEMVTGLPASATAVLNVDDSRVNAMAQLTRASVVRFGLGDGADVKGSDVEATSTGTSFTLTVDGVRRGVSLKILGEHQVTNALATIAASRALGIDPDRAVAALESITRAERWRMELFARPDGVVVINDAYNASPDSMSAALKTLAQITRDGKRSVAVLGEMAELGDYADDEHDRIGRLAVRLNIAQLVVVGHNARHIHNAAGLEGSWDGESVFVETADEAYDLLRDRLREGDVVLVKSSASARLRYLGDRIAEATT
jgi:UDP-N-acetylmuramoyl-tripeptide--D-alanyl-D-alanine ligase